MHGGQIHIGIGGCSFAPWQGIFYPTGLPAQPKLSVASRHLTPVRVGTYCCAQSPDSVQKWHDGFAFAINAPRYVANRKALADAGISTARLLGVGRWPLADKRGPINWQFVTFEKFDPYDFAPFLAFMPEQQGAAPCAMRSRSVTTASATTALLQ